MHGLIFSVAANSWKTCTISKGHTEAAWIPFLLILNAVLEWTWAKVKQITICQSGLLNLSVYMFTYMFTCLHAVHPEMKRKFKKKTLPLWHTSPFSGDGLGYNAFLPSCGCPQAFLGSEVKHARPEMLAGLTPRPCQQTTITHSHSCCDESTI